MWRIHSLVGRVLSRVHGNSPLRLSQGHHVEDEVINTSTGRLASDSGSQKGGDGEQRKRRRTSQFCYAGLSRYNAMDAVGWGAAAVLVMHICRRIHSQFSSVSDQSPAPSRPRELIHKCGYRVLLETLSRRDVLPRGLSVSCLRGAPELRDASAGASSGSSSGSGGVESGQASHQQGATLSHDSSRSEESVSDTSLPQEGEEPEAIQDKESLSPEESLTEAAENLRHVADSSVPIILNIIGLESAKAGDYETAFSCFLAAAQQSYSKAQFNVGVCYERGRGVRKDHAEAVQFYRRAAATGHRQAQYRCAKLLLSSRGQQSTQDRDTAITLLQSAAAAGLTEAQLYLGVLFSQDPVRDGGKSVVYLRMAANSGDGAGLLYLGQCYERGFGVPQCISTAVGLYQQAAVAGHQQAKNTLASLYSREEDVVLRSIRSAPCFSAVGQLRLASMISGVLHEAAPGPEKRSDWPVRPLPHSWSTGSLIARPPVRLHPPSTDNAHSGWTIGVG